jgi:replication factor C subunit 2/4
MRYAINNLQATYSGLGNVTADNVFKVVDQPHPIVIKTILAAAADGDLYKAINGLEGAASLLCLPHLTSASL